MKLLKALEPSIFPADVDLSGTPVMEQCHYVARLLNARLRSDLPTTTHDIPCTQVALITALSQHYNETAGLVGEKAIANLKAGYFKAEGTTVTCNLDQGEPKHKLEFEYADEISITNTLDCMSLCTVTTSGRAMKIDSLWQELHNAGVSLPYQEVDWKGDMLRDTKIETTSVTPRKLKADSPVPAQASASSAFASKESQMLGDALGRKLAPKPSPTKKGDGNSASSSNGH